MNSNFEFLKRYWPELARQGAAAEACAGGEPEAFGRQTELLARQAAGVICSCQHTQLPEQSGDWRRKLEQENRLPRQIGDIFAVLGRTSEPGTRLLLAFHLCCWIMQTYGDWDFSVGEGWEQTAPDMPREERNPEAQAAAEALPLTGPELALLQREAVQLQTEVLGAAGFSVADCGAEIIRSVSVTNRSDTDIRDAELTITASPEFALPFTHRIECLPARQTLTLSHPGLKLNTAYLAALEDRTAGTLHFQVEAGERETAADRAELSVLPFDCWPGTACYPELLAAYVLPDEPVVLQILSRAAECLRGVPLDGYASQDPERVLRQADAIFMAMRELGVSYCSILEPFDRVGHPVRLCGTAAEQKLGSCLDLSLMYCACLEAAGLHPLLITAHRHVYTGLWLEPRMFPEAVQDDISIITKRLAPGICQIAVAEATYVTVGREWTFAEAREAAERTLRSAEYIIDIRRARLSGIQPLPRRIKTESGWQILPRPTDRRNAAVVSKRADEPEPLREKTENMPKKVQWERKLLDLGMRNTLINLRLRKTQVPVLTTSLEALENALADGSDFSILPRPADMHAEENSFEAFRELGRAEIVQEEFRNRRLRCPLTESELQKNLKELYRSARTALEENGANTLYLALGLLRWYETRQSTKARYAPVILLPVEMVRRSASLGYVLRLRDDEPQMNITLLEKLKQDFEIQIEGLDPLPVDEHGIDIRQVLTVMRKAVLEQPRWDVLETATLGIFSFSQFVMWNDIRSRTEDLLHNKVVRSLMDGKLAWNAGALQMGERVPEDGVLLPMPADASQLFAIEAACSGESFVLHGPPGTGKSQTITSLIANALAQGKSVLFVAEKMAALAVVQKRLNQIGIGPFCLELHSNKSRKRDVLEQLQQASEVTRDTSAQDFEMKARNLSALRGELDDYAQSLHRVLPCGRTLYALMNQYEDVKEAPRLEPFNRAFIRSLDSSRLEAIKILTERLTAAGRAVGHPAGHPLEAVGCTRYTQQLRSSLVEITEAYQMQIRELSPWTDMLTQALGREKISGPRELDDLREIAEEAACWYEMPGAWAGVEFPDAYFEDVQRMTAHFSQADALHRQLLQTFREDVLTLDGSQLLSEFVQASGKWILAQNITRNRLRRQLNVFAIAPIDKADLQQQITLLRDCQQQEAAGMALLSRYGADLEHRNHGRQSDWQEIADLAARARVSARILQAAGGSRFRMHFCGNPQYREAVFGLQNGYRSFMQTQQAVKDLLNIVPEAHTDWLKAQDQMCCSILQHRDQLKEWITFSGIAAEAEAMGLGNLLESYRSGLAHEEVLPACRRALLYGLIYDAIDGEEALNSFSGPVFNEKIQQFKRADEQWRALSRQEVYCRLAARVPDFTREAAHSSELGILQRAIKSGGRGVSIRRLFDQIPNLLPRLCPCMLMSPISAAQYLDPKREPFDIVVFDEASQLPTCKAVGVLARGRDAVIVGDPRQMPPTSFFAVNTVDEENLETEDLESILDDCLALNMPQSHLLCHYRSRHESLIAFSNSRFYENRLLTFPSVNDRESKVHLTYVDGIFERGGRRINPAEARAVVEELRRRAAEPALTGQSVGVVTFNISQQNLIEDLLNEACAADPELEKWAFQSEEPVFIKNLENVQGDERDVILFSVGYGPDENGRVSMNFGPLNRDGGWRRLNVAVSRARCEMMVFSTLHPEQIDLNRTQSEGVAALRAFLSYAEGRAMALDEASAGEVRTVSGTAREICCALEEQGYDTQVSVGRSACRVDIGVVDPAQPDRYILGILLDGEGYGKARTTRDRELAQIGVLGSLGWNLLRVWSMDWWDDRDKEISRILDRLHRLETGDGEPEELQEAPVQTPTPPAQKAARPAAAPVYRETALPAAEIPAEAFTEPKYAKRIRQKAEKIISLQAPVSESALIRQVVQSFGITRAGTRIQSYLQQLLGDFKTTRQEDVLFYWQQDPAAYRFFRVSGQGDMHRDIRDVPAEEIACAAWVVLYEQISMSHEDLLRETARKLGYNRMSSNVTAAAEAGIRYGADKISCSNSGILTLTAAGTAAAEEVLQNFQNP